MSEEFRVVTGKRRVARKTLKLPTQHNDDDGSDTINVPKFEVRLTTLCAQISNSAYCTTAKHKLNSCLELLQLPNPVKLKRLVCLGIGPFTRNYQALHQLAFMLSLQRELKITEAIYYDPIFSEAEKELLRRSNCLVMTENYMGKHEAVEPTLYYLPHCPNSLTNNLLWCNWRPEMLSNVVLINNAFSFLCGAKAERLLRLDSEYLLKILPLVVELPLEDDYETPSVFNNLAIHVFPKNTLSQKCNGFWERQETPVYADDELIMA